MVMIILFWGSFCYYGDVYFEKTNTDLVASGFSVCLVEGRGGGGYDKYVKC